MDDSNSPDFAFNDISTEFVYKELSSLCLNPESLASPLTYVFNRSLPSSEILNSWKCVTVAPLHKSGSLSDLNNFRPICAFSCYKDF